MGLRPLEIFLLLQHGDRLQTSESDVYRRQILTTKVDPRAVRVNYGLFKYISVLKGVYRRQILMTKVDPRAVRVNYGLFKYISVLKGLNLYNLKL